MTKNAKNSYDVSRDLILAKPLLVHIDDATGGEMSGPGEGVSSFAILLRSMRTEEGAAGPHKIAISGVFVSKGSANAQPRWTINADGSCTLQTHPAAGALCIASAMGREVPSTSAVVFARAAQYAAKVSAALARKAQKAA